MINFPPGFDDHKDDPSEEQIAHQDHNDELAAETRQENIGLYGE